MRKIAPSVLAADFLHLEKDVRLLNKHADIIHLDVMDGTLVPNISFGFSVIEPVLGIAEIPTDIHLMIINPDKYFKRCADLGTSMLSFHYRAARKARKSPATWLKQIRSLGMRAGIVLNPDVPVEEVFPYLKYADYVLIMSVYAGFGGQSFIEESYERIKALKAEISRQGLDCLIEVDGGVSLSNAGALFDAGVDILVAGSSVFKAGDPAAVIEELRRA